MAACIFIQNVNEIPIFLKQEDMKSVKQRITSVSHFLNDKFSHFNEFQTTFFLGLKYFKFRLGFV